MIVACQWNTAERRKIQCHDSTHNMSMTAEIFVPQPATSLYPLYLSLTIISSPVLPDSPLSQPSYESLSLPLSLSLFLSLLSLSLSRSCTHSHLQLDQLNTVLEGHALGLAAPTQRQKTQNITHTEYQRAYIYSLFWKRSLIPLSTE